MNSDREFRPDAHCQSDGNLTGTRTGMRCPERLSLELELGLDVVVVSSAIRAWKLTMALGTPTPLFFMIYQNHGVAWAII